MLVRIKSAIDKDAWYAGEIGHTMNLIDMNNPLYFFADLYAGLPVFKLDVEILDNVKEKAAN